MMASAWPAAAHEGLQELHSDTVTPAMVTASLAPARQLERADSGPTDAPKAALRLAVQAYERGRIAEADAAASALGSSLAGVVAEWAAVRSGSPAVGWRRIAAFLRGNLDWGPAGSLRRRLEEAMLAQRASHADVRAALAGRTPLTPSGRIALALALKDEGRAADALGAIRVLWRSEPMSRELETLVLRAFGDELTARDHRNRMELYLFRENREGAVRNAARAGADYGVLVQARLAVAARSSSGAALLERVPAALRTDTSFVFAKAQAHRRKDEADIAARLIADLPRDLETLVDGDEWWTERRLIARQLLDKGQPELAYTVAARHSAQRPQQRMEAEWHAGWIALRFLNRPDAALPHFTQAAALAETPISIARAAYWQGRALESLDLGEQAEAAFMRAAGQPVAYYGQLARAHLGLAELPLRQTSPAETAASLPARALALLEEIGERGLARNLGLEIARTHADAAEVEKAARIAHRAGDVRQVLNIAKLAVQRGLPLDVSAFPTNGVPAFQPAGLFAEPPIVHAIARQESAFDPRAMSHAGARGLMQLMPATARETARRIGAGGFDLGRLTADPVFNARLGAAHLGDLLKEWRGSYILTFAAYNAGSGNVRDWIDAYGDPRDPAVDAIDWVERIPFTETRNYVQRIMENLQVYRTVKAGDPRLLIADDMRRGRRAARFGGESESGGPAP
jgi:soluble lytic murein transglycosylase